MADTAHDRVHVWLTDHLNDPPKGATATGPVVALAHHYASTLAARILDSATVWEEFGVRTPDGTEIWATSEDLARSWIARNTSPLTLISRPVITLPGEAVDG